MGLGGEVFPLIQSYVISIAACCIVSVEELILVSFRAKAFVTFAIVAF